LVVKVLFPRCYGALPNNRKYELIPDLVAENYIAWLLGSKKTLKGVEGVIANAQGVHHSFDQFKITIE
jgi:hypothetical protein